MNTKDLSSRRLLWTGYTALPLLLILSVVFVLPVAVYIVATGGDINAMPIGLLLLLTVAAEVAVIGIGLLIVQAGRDSWALLGLKNFSLKTVLMGAGAGFLFFFGLQFLAYLITLSGGSASSSDTSVALTEATGANGIIILFLLVPFLVPFVEELFFRGYVYGFLARGHGVEDKVKGQKKLWLPITFSSIFFALAHFQGAGSFTDAFVLVWVLFFAVALGFIRQRTGSLYPTFAAHSMYNLLTAIALFMTL